MSKGNAYGKALYDLATEEQLEDRMYRELQEIRTALLENPEIITLLDCPGIPAASRLLVVTEGFGEAHIYVQNLLSILTEKRQMHRIYSCVDAYLAAYETAHHIAHVKAITAVPMKKRAMQQLEHKLSRQKGQKIILHNQVDASILGGVILQFPNSQIDASLLGCLQEASQELKKINFRGELLWQ